jgi:hypothetical protein
MPAGAATIGYDARGPLFFHGKLRDGVNVCIALRQVWEKRIQACEGSCFRGCLFFCPEVYPCWRQKN